MMKTLSVILIGWMLAGCAGMGTGEPPVNDMHRYADPSNIYFGA
jgi:hypothetical protein